MSACTCQDLHQPVTLELDRRGDATVVRLGGELAGRAVEAARTMLHNALAQASGLVVFDLADLCFLNASGIGLLVDLNRRLRSERGNMALARVRDPVRQVLRLTSVDTLLPIWDTVEQAVAAEL